MNRRGFLSNIMAAGAFVALPFDDEFKVGDRIRVSILEYGDIFEGTITKIGNNGKIYYNCEVLRGTDGYVHYYPTHIRDFEAWVNVKEFRNNKHRLIERI